MLLACCCCCCVCRTKRKSGNKDTEDFVTARGTQSAWRIAWSFYAGAVGSWVIVTPVSFEHLSSTGLRGTGLAVPSQQQFQKQHHNGSFSFSLCGPCSHHTSPVVHTCVKLGTLYIYVQEPAGAAAAAAVSSCRIRSCQSIAERPLRGSQAPNPLDGSCCIALVPDCMT